MPHIIAQHVEILNLDKKMAPRRGLEPPTYRLTAECSTIELSRNVITNIIITGLIIFATLFSFFIKKISQDRIIYLLALKAILYNLF